MSIRDDLFEYIGDRTVSREELQRAFPVGDTLRKALFRSVGMKELIRDGDSYRVGTRQIKAHRLWGADEDAVIAANMGKPYRQIAELLTERSDKAVKRRALALGLASSKPRPKYNLAWPAFTRGNLSPVVQSRWAA